MKVLKIVIAGIVIGLLLYGAYRLLRTDDDIASPVPDDMLRIIKLTPGRK